MDILELGLFYDFDEEEIIAGGEEKLLSASDALIKCVNKYGRVDLTYISELSGMTVSEIVALLSGKAIFQEPLIFTRASEWSETEGWLLASQYLCGNIPEKLRIAKEVNERFCCFDRNVAALERLLPEKVDAMSIHASLGATWIPKKIYERFIASLLGIGQKHISVIFNKELAVYRITLDDKELGKKSVANNYTYGTPDMPALRIIEYTMNAKTAKVYDYLRTVNKKGQIATEAVINHSKTVAAQEKQAQIVARFDDWIHEDRKCIAQISEAYNDRFVGYTFTPFDGSFLKLDDLNPEVVLFPHQKNCVARMLLSAGNLLLAHDVGTGKTYEMICGAHELYRTGLSRRNLIVVPNNTLGAVERSHKYLYPSDNILVISPADFKPDKRNEVLEEIRDGDYVAVYMAFSSFDMLVMSKKYWVEKQQKRIIELRRAAGVKANENEKRMLNSEADQLAEKLNEYILKAADCPWLPFDQLGIETLFIDEAHNYKNIALRSRTDNISGLHSKGSKKCIEMFEKAHFVKRIIMATGTPLTNSMADLFIFQLYLQQEELEFNGIGTLEMWANSFADINENYEVSIDTKHLRLKRRFTRFHNIPELLAMFSTVCDFYRAEDKCGLPDFNGYEEILVPKSPWQELYIESLVQRADAIHERLVKRDEDNFLRITTDGRLCALDIRLADKELYDAESVEYTKTQACADKVIKLFCTNPGTCQLVFSDIGTPKSAFNVYDDLKRRLIRMGMPAGRIAFIHDAVTDDEKTSLFDKMNRGEISICVGSTKKLGTGVNVQERLIALHHLDVPWKPADMIQREGRLLRQGNLCDKVYIYHYVTEGTFDSYSWQVLEKKASFVQSFLSGIATSRDEDEIDDTVLRYSEIKALAIGNPLIKQRVETANKLNRMKVAFRTRQRELLDLREIVSQHPGRINLLTEQMPVISKDIKLYAANRLAIPMEERQAFGEELIEALKDNYKKNTERFFDEYRGFKVYLPMDMTLDKAFIVLRTDHGGHYTVEIDMAKPLGCSQRIDYMLEHLPDKLSLLRTRKRDANKRAQTAQAEIDRGNAYQAEVDVLIQNLERIDNEIKRREEAEDQERKAHK